MKKTMMLALLLAPFWLAFGQTVMPKIKIDVKVSVGEPFVYSLNQHFEGAGGICSSSDNLPVGLLVGRDFEEDCLLLGTPKKEGDYTFRVVISAPFQRSEVLFTLKVTSDQPEIIPFLVYRYEDGWFPRWNRAEAGKKFIVESLAGRFSSQLELEDKTCTATELGGVQVLINSIPQGICAVLGRTLVFKAGPEIQQGTDVLMVVQNVGEGKKSNTIKLRAPGPDE